MLGKKSNEAKMLPILCVCDILLFPYIRVLSCSFTMIYVLLWSMYNINKILNNEKTIVGLVFLVLVSHLVGFVTYNSFNGISTSAIIIFAGLLLVYLKETGARIPVRKILVIYLLIAFIGAIVYILVPRLYFNIRTFWTMSGETIEFTEYMISRYTFIYSDPNNAGCVFVGILAYLLLFEDISKLWMTIFCIVATCTCVIATFSVTGILMLVAVLCVFFIKRFKRKANYLAAMLILMIAAVLVLLCCGPILFKDSAIFDILFARIELNMESGSMGGRTDIWRYAIENIFSWKNMLIGNGAVLDNHAVEYRPHSGVLHLLLAYGFPATVIFCKIFVDKQLLKNAATRMRYVIVLMPFGAILLINTGLSDYRFMTAMALIVAAMSNKSKISERKVKTYE